MTIGTPSQKSMQYPVQGGTAPQQGNQMLPHTKETNFSKHFDAS